MRPSNKQLKSIYYSHGSMGVQGDKPITNGATAKVQIASQRTVCLKICTSLHRLPSAGSKNLRMSVRSSYGPEFIPYAENTRRAVTSRMGVMMTRADLECR